MLCSSVNNIEPTAAPRIDWPIKKLICTSKKSVTASDQLIKSRACIPALILRSSTVAPPCGARTRSGSRNVHYQWPASAGRVAGLL